MKVNQISYDLADKREENLSLEAREIEKVGIKIRWIQLSTNAVPFAQLQSRELLQNANPVSNINEGKKEVVLG